LTAKALPATATARAAARSDAGLFRLGAGLPGGNVFCGSGLDVLPTGRRDPVL